MLHSPEMGIAAGVTQQLATESYNCFGVGFGRIFYTKMEDFKRFLLKMFLLFKTVCIYDTAFL